MDKKSMTQPAHSYPQISATLIKEPNRLYAFFVLGFVVKIFILIPQYIELFFLGIAALVMVILINPFVVLFTGKYWKPAHALMSGIFKLSTKIYFYFFGLTNKYPGFDFTIKDNFSIEIPMPQKPSRFFAIPVLGGVARIIMLIPFMIYEGVIRYAAFLGMVASAFPVLFKGRYPESTFEIERDSLRLNLAMSMYMVGFSDKYPSFWISMNHQTTKIVLIILGALMWAGNIGNSVTKEERRENMQYNQQDMMKQQQMMQEYDTSFPSQQ
jgi:hypothetical protein